MMNDILANFIRARRIDSFLKLRLLLLLQQNPQMKGTQEELAKRLHLGPAFLLEGIITDLHRTDLITCIDNHYTLQDEPEIREALYGLAQAFENPLTRLDLLVQLKSSPVHQHYPEIIDEHGWLAAN
jgi:hypothetical protein